MTKFKIINYNPMNEKMTMETKVNEWLKTKPEIHIQTINVIHSDTAFAAPTALLIFYEEKENNHE